MHENRETSSVFPHGGRSAGGAYVPTFFVGMCAPLVPLRPPPFHGTLSIASSEA